ncbi:hypothetical protein Palpr_2370 [Paludibacter propionicigenes WB4]|uniref:Uncharacterized protein n=1 Tax=Paludibacter propionicigenes (strain DSM 17365 / JCM 13257 / WB4) TaxID=694427 RepID=E4T709_PALPW|nr:hypothetical protein [Paludibacter propionicigenes]ADQ80503.1 hypothetical protein Palpr_2370 [Paludibacter propionicigenes WB4]
MEALSLIECRNTQKAMNGILKILKYIVVILIIFSLFGLLMELGFSYFNQSKNQEHKLTFMNFLLPWLITVGFMIFGSIEMYTVRTNIVKTKIILILLGLLELISIRWQFEFLIWTIEKRNIGDIFPILTGILMIAFVFVKLSLNLVKLKRQEK